MSSVIRKYQRVIPDLEEVKRNKYKSVYIENAAIITKESFLRWSLVQYPTDIFLFEGGFIYIDLK